MIPLTVKIKNGPLPDAPGVYLFFDAQRTLLYIGKATCLRKRVASYFVRPGRAAGFVRQMEAMVEMIASIEWIETPSVIEALVLEANLIRARRPALNVRLKDDKSFLYLALSDEPYPRPLFLRGLDLARRGFDPFTDDRAQAKRAGYLAVYGPFTSPQALRNALDLLRNIFPWSTCHPPMLGKRVRPCFYVHLRRCPGVCIGAITPIAYRRSIRGLMQFFDGRKTTLIRRLEQEMRRAADGLRFEDAAVIKRQVEALLHIRDVSVITRDFSPLPYERPDQDAITLHRVEAYDISNMSGAAATGSMVVFLDGKPAKAQYRKFHIKTVAGPNDVAMMQEVLRRRLKRAERAPRAWALPDVMVIDGGVPQVNAVRRVLEEVGVSIPLVGLAKGPDRKRDTLVFDRTNPWLASVVPGNKALFQSARDEAHRFAVSYHRQLRKQSFLAKKK